MKEEKKTIRNVSKIFLLTALQSDDSNKNTKVDKKYDLFILIGLFLVMSKFISATFILNHTFSGLQFKIEQSQ